mmetsp:Transcript_22968/g.33575  ORF Transcript_22968/g.33575 Transcript_22968/m.33575 type:complete len:81 (-) Transcript_22968:1069-1311(-)
MAGCTDILLLRSPSRLYWGVSGNWVHRKLLEVRVQLLWPNVWEELGRRSLVFPTCLAASDGYRAINGAIVLYFNHTDGKE